MIVTFLDRVPMEKKQGQGARIALAEDDPTLRNMMVRLLEKLGHTVVFAAGNGAELLEHAFEAPIDVVLVDLDMPVVDGLAAAEQISDKGIPVILISGHPDVFNVVVEHEPVVMRLLKPATAENLQKAITHALLNGP